MPFVESTRQKSKMLALFAGFGLTPSVGLACYRLAAWTMFRGESGIPDANFAAISHTMQAIAIILILIIDRRISYNEAKVLRAIVVGVLFVIVGTILFLFDQSNIFTIYIGGALCGAASAVALLGWGYYFCSVEPRKSAFNLTCAFALYGLATWALSSAPASVLSFIMLAGPLGSCACLYFSITHNNGSFPEEPLTRKILAPLPWGMFALLLICMLISTLAKLIVPVTDVLLTSAYRIYWPAIFISIFLIFCFWIFVLKRKDTNRLWPIFILVIFSGLLFYSTFATTQPAFASSFFRATQECLMLLCYIEVCGMVYQRRLPRVVFFGLSVLIFLEPPTILSSILPVFFPAAGSAEGQIPAIVVTAAMSLILMVITIVLVSMKSNRNPQNPMTQAEEEGSTSTLIAALEELSDAYGLTKRETEIAYYLTKAYTLPQIADTLCLSLNTVRSHSKQLYRKMDIHKKQELISRIVQKNNPL